MIDLMTVFIIILAIFAWWSLNQVAISVKAKEAIGFGIFFFAIAFIAASRDPVLISVALLFFVMKVLTSGAKPPKKFEDSVRSKWMPQYP